MDKKLGHLMAITIESEEDLHGTVVFLELDKYYKTSNRHLLFSKISNG